MVLHQYSLQTVRLLDPCFKTGWRNRYFQKLLALVVAAAKVLSNPRTMFVPELPTPTRPQSSDVQRKGSSWRKSSLEATSSNDISAAPFIALSPLSPHASGWLDWLKPAAPCIDSILFPGCNFRFFLLVFRRSFQLSFAVLLRYRSLCHI